MHSDVLTCESVLHVQVRITYSESPWQPLNNCQREEDLHDGTYTCKIKRVRHKFHISLVHIKITGQEMFHPKKKQKKC